MKTLVVVGPNRGDSQIAEMCQRHERFIFFEPLPIAAQWLRDNNKNVPNFILVEAACGAKAGEAVLNVYNQFGLSSSLGVCTDQARDKYKQHDLSLRNQITVKVVNLYEWLVEHEIEEIETLVTDAQGMDLTILKTLKPMLYKHKIKHIQCEADGRDFKHYEGLPDNSMMGFYRLMGQYPLYTPRVLPDRNDWNPDLVWDLEFKNVQRQH